MRTDWVILLVGLTAAAVDAISYRCENNQVLIVQSFGNDTIRMHCQKLDLCGNRELYCNYDREQPSCGGKNNFVSHVNQVTPTGPVAHTCCELQDNASGKIIGHDGNDCFVYELPDGSHDPEIARKRKIHGVDYSEFTVLQNASQIPEQFDGYVGYRMKLFMLRNKSPPSLIVKAIERLPEGYRVTICRPRCGNFHSEGAVGHHEKTENPPKTISGDIMHGKVQSPAEWAAASWSSWSSSSWSSWSTSKLVGEEDVDASKRGKVRGDRVGEESSSERESTGSNALSANSGQLGFNNISGGGQPVPNINVNAQGHGGQGGAGGQGFGGTVNVSPGVGGASVAGSKASAAGVGVGGGAGDKAGAGLEGLLGRKNPDDGDSDKGDADKNKGKKGEQQPGLSGLGSGAGKEGDLDGGDGSGKLRKGGLLPIDRDDGGREGNGKGGSAEEGTGATMVMEPDGSHQAIDKGDEEDKAPKTGSQEAGSGNDGSGDGSGDGKGPDKTGLGGKDGVEAEGDGLKGFGGKVITGPSHLSSEKPETDGGDGQGANGSAEKAAGDGVGGDGDNNGKGTGEEAKGTDDASGDGDKTGKKSEENGAGVGAGAVAGPGKGNGDDGGLDGGATKDGGEGDKPLRNSQEVGAGAAAAGPGEVPPASSAETAEQELARINAEDKNGGENEEGDDNGAPEKESKEKFPARSGEDKAGSGEGAAGTEDAGTDAGPPEGVGTDGGDGSEGGEAAKPDAKVETDGGDGDGTDVEGTDKAGSKGKGTDKTGADTDGDAGAGSGEAGSAGNGANHGDSDSSGGQGANHGNGNKGTGKPAQPATKTGKMNPKLTGVKTSSQDAAPPRPKVQAAQTTATTGGGGGGGGGMTCFSGDVLVTTVTGRKRMDEIEVGDLILVPASGGVHKLERVEMFYHREPETVSKFVQIRTRTGQELTLSPLHLLPSGDCQELVTLAEDVETLMRGARFAHRVQPGECVVTVDEASGALAVEPVAWVGRKIARGIYSPMTTEGALVVNGVLASCFSQIESHAIQKLAYDALYGFYSLFGLLQTAVVEVQGIPSMLDYIHVLSSYVLPFAKY